MGGPFRRALVRGIRFFVVRPAALFGLAALLLALVAAALLASAFGPSLPGLARPGAEPAATEEYLRGNRDYDADLMWDSLSEAARQRLQAQGSSPDDLRRQMQAARERGARLEEFSYIGGKALPDGTSVQFYLVAIRPQPKAEVEYQPYMFTLDRDGKIAKVQ